MKMKTHRLNILSAAFAARYPGGRLTRAPEHEGKYAYHVVFQPGGKVYTYRCRNLYDLAERLGLATQAVNDALAGYRRLPCGCPVETSFAGWRCPNCGRQLRQPTAEELADWEEWVS